jgi:hypothetical protein
MRESGQGRTRLGVAVAVTVGALVLAPPAAAKKRDYQGPIGPSGAISFTVKGKGDRAKVLDLEWYRLPVKCGKKEDVSTASLNYAVPVEDGKFEASAVLGPKRKPKAEAIIKGRINGDRARGSIIVRGSKLPISDGTGKCDSGKRPWNAAG